MQGETKSGFKYDIDDRILNDWRYTMALTKCQHPSDIKKLEGATEMVQLMFGDDGLEKFMDHIKERNDGFVPIEVVIEEVQSIFESKIPKN